MNIKDLPKGSYKVVSPTSLNIKDLPAGSYKTVNSPQTSQPSAGSGFLDRLKKAAGAGWDQIKAGAKEISNNRSANPGPVFEGALRAGAGVVNAVTSPISAAISPVVEPIVNAAANKISNNPTVQKFATSKAGKVTERVVDNVNNFNTIAGAVVGSKAALKAGSGIKDALTSAGKAASAESSASALEATLGKRIQDATPSYSKKIVSEPSIKLEDGSVLPRVNESKGLKTRTVNPTPFEVDAGKALLKIENYPIKGTNLEKYQVVQPEITRMSNELARSLKAENILRPPQQIAKVVRDAVNAVPEKSLLLQKSDPVIANYMRITKNAIEMNDGTLAGELKVRQALDKAYENARGKLAFGSDKISSLDEIHKAARDALNQDIITHAQNTDVKAALKSQWDLIRASDVLRNKAEAESGSPLGRFGQNHPLINNMLRGVVRTGANAAGVGAVIH